MVSMEAIYLGDKHCEITHGPSGRKIETDAPKDNNGRGEAFSPTDLLGASLASCILTTMAIVAERDQIELKGSHASVTKEMSTTPRRVARLPVDIHLPKSLAMESRAKLERVAHTCPVHHSLHPEIDMTLTFHYDV